METTDKHILLLYPVGHSDLNLDGKGLGRDPNFRLLVKVLAGEVRVEDAEPAVRTLLLADDGSRKPLTFPILVPIINFVHEEPPTLPIRVMFLLSDQPGDDPSDTIGFDRVVADWLTAAGQAEVAMPVDILEPGILKTRVWHYDDAAAAYAALKPALDEKIRQATACYISATTGTPAMSFSTATVLGPDARVKFIYKPFRKKDTDPDPRPIKISQFRQLPRERTLEIVDAAVASFDIALAYRVLRKPTTGFDPNHPTIANVCHRLGVLECWQGELYAEAAARADLGRLKPEDFAMSGLVHGLQTSPPGEADWPSFWRRKLIDIALRLQIARARGDVPGYVDRLKHFLDVSRLFALCWYGLSEDAKGAKVKPTTAGRRQYTHYASLDADAFYFKEEFQQTALLSWRIRNPRRRDRQPEEMAAWLDTYLRLRFLAGETLRRYRNDHIHSTVEFERKTLDVFVETEFPPAAGELPAGAGAALVSALVLDTLNALPGDEAPAAAVAELLKQCLYIPAAVAAAYGLRRPMLSLGVHSTLSAAADPASHLLDPFRGVVEDTYAAKARSETAALIVLLEQIKTNLRANIAAAAAEPSLAALQDRLAALNDAVNAWDASRVPGLAECAMIGFDVRDGLAARLRKRVFETAAPGKPIRAVSGLADQFGRANTAESRACVLVRLLT